MSDTDPSNNNEHSKNNDKSDLDVSPSTKGENNNIYAGTPAISKKRRAISPIWLLPIVTVIVVGWLGYKNWLESAIEIELLFESGDGIEAGQTPVLYQGLKMGTVSDTTLNDDMRTVTVTIAMKQQAAPLLKSGTKFWLVNPKISLRGVSGIETLLTGNFISLQPGGGEDARSFIAIPESPPPDEDSPGLRLILETEALGTINVGAPVLFHQVTVGVVEDFALLPAGGVDIVLRIDEKYRHLVKPNSYFWNTSGIRVKGGVQNFDIQTGSLASIVAGGIEFDTPEPYMEGVVEKNARFPLYANRDHAGSLSVTLLFDSADGVEEQTEVRLRGRPVGVVERVQFENDNPKGRAVVTARLSRGIRPWIDSNSRFWVHVPEFSANSLTDLGALLSGTAIEVDVGEKGAGTPKTRFEGLPEQPVKSILKPGARFKLRAEDAASVTVGTPIFHRKLAVGEVESLSINGDGVDIVIFIEKTHAKRVQKNSIFWNSSGLNIEASLNGISVNTESVAAILAGGIAFANPNSGEKASASTRFNLHSSYEQGLAKDNFVFSILFDEPTGLTQGSAIKYKGIKVGEITRVSLDKQLKNILVDAVLMPSAATLARQGSLFWVVKPELGITEVKNLENLVSGNHLTVLPGTGPAQTKFLGLNKPPAQTPANPGLLLTLKAQELGSLKKGVPVYYRGVAVGSVIGHQLGANAQWVEIFVNIEPRYAVLVTSASRFWNQSGVSVDFSVLNGASVRSRSLESLISGGIAFATPDTNTDGEPVRNGHEFELADDPKESWLRWRPEIPVGR